MLAASIRREPAVKSLLLFVAMAAAPAAVDPELAWALAYQLPAHDCRAPDLRPTNNSATRVEKFRRQAKRYSSCVKTHQQALLADHDRIRRSARHGVSSEEAQVLKQHMDEIGTRIKSLAESVELVTMSELEAERLANQGARTSGAQYP
jgi:hypothetical protein